MIHGDFEVRAARIGDIDGILALQEANLPAQGGLLSVRLSADWFQEAIAGGFIMTALRAGEVVGYAAATPLSWQADIPIIQAMMQAVAIPDDSYIFGPACVAEAVREHGLAHRMLKEAHAVMGGRPCRTFIREDNAVSRRAALKAGMREIGMFRCGETGYVAMAYEG